MTTTATRQRMRLGARLVWLLGWTCIAAGALVGLYLVYTLLYTNSTTDRAQADLGQRWEAQVTEGTGASTPTQGSPDSAAAPDADPALPDEADPPDLGEAVAMLEFTRPSGEPVVAADPLYVIEGVGQSDLQRGPGHYPTTGGPGEPNFAVAGHRTTYGAPFFRLDELAAGDTATVTDRSGERYDYRVVEQRIVGPRDISVLGEDPRGSGRPTLTLTTCHPRFSAAQRLIIFAELMA